MHYKDTTGPSEEPTNASLLKTQHLKHSHCLPLSHTAGGARIQASWATSFSLCPPHWQPVEGGGGVVQRCLLPAAQLEPGPRSQRSACWATIPRAALPAARRWSEGRAGAGAGAGTRAALAQARDSLPQVREAGKRGFRFPATRRGGGGGRAAAERGGVGKRGTQVPF